MSNHECFCREMRKISFGGEKYHLVKTLAYLELWLGYIRFTLVTGALT